MWQDALSASGPDMPVCVKSISPSSLYTGLLLPFL